MKLIDKDAVVAEIEKMLQEEYPCDNSEQTIGYHYALYELQGFLNTLEVKEVDLEKYGKSILSIGVMWQQLMSNTLPNTSLNLVCK